MINAIRRERRMERLDRLVRVFTHVRRRSADERAKLQRAGASGRGPGLWRKCQRAKALQRKRLSR